MPIPDEALAQMRAHLDDIDFDAVAAYERRFRHDVMAHVHAFGDVAPAAHKFIHLGATSAFVTDNADLILMRRGLVLLRGQRAARAARARRVRARVARRADARLHAPAAGAADDGRQARDAVDAGSRARPRGPRAPHRDAALPRREGHDRHAGELPRALRAATTRRCASSTALVTAKIGLRVVDSRHRADVLAEARRAGARRRRGIAASAAKFSADIRMLQAFGEIEEPFEREQIGSSAMAYKRNPMRSERIASLARFVVVARAEREPDARRAVLRADARRQREPPPRDPGVLPRDRRHPRPDGERRVAASRCIRRASAAA